MSIDYRKILSETLLQFVKNVLLVVQKEGLDDEQLCYITFLTSNPNVVLSNVVKSRYPNEITIVLQHQFEDLEVYNDYFSVKLRFNDVEEIVKVPFNSIINFSDPSVNFYLKFNPTTPDTSELNLEIEEESLLTENVSPDIDENKVINLDSFRNKNKIN